MATSVFFNYILFFSPLLGLISIYMFFFYESDITIHLLPKRVVKDSPGVYKENPKKGKREHRIYKVL